MNWHTYLGAKKDSNSGFTVTKFRLFLFQDTSHKNVQIVISPATRLSLWLLLMLWVHYTHIFESTHLLLFNATPLIQATITAYLNYCHSFLTKLQTLTFGRPPMKRVAHQEMTQQWSPPIHKSKTQMAQLIEYK